MHDVLVTVYPGCQPNWHDTVNSHVHCDVEVRLREDAVLWTDLCGEEIEPNLCHGIYEWTRST